jgi:hypothetical protein
MYISFVFVGFLLFIVIHAIFERCKIYNSDNMDLARLEQNLRFIQHSQQSFHNLFYSIWEWKWLEPINGAHNQKGKKLEWMNFAWRPFRDMLKKNKIQKVVEDFKKVQESNENHLSRCRKAHFVIAFQQNSSVKM